MRTTVRFILALVAIACLAGCTGGLPPILTQWIPVATPATPAPQTAVPAVPTQPGNTPVPTPEPSLAGPLHLTLWIPPEFNPGADTASAGLLRDQLKAFESQNPDIRVDVRVKAAGGPSGLLASLTAASAAAPAALPDLIALPRQDLESAVLKGLLFPYDGLTAVSNDPDWFSYARQLAVIGGSTYGLPFAGDALLLVYRPAHLTGIPTDWQSLLSQSVPVAFPSADPGAAFTITQYMAEGGAVADIQGRPYLDSAPLGRVLKNYSSGAKQGVFPPWLSQYETDQQSWQAYNAQQAQMAVTWVTRYLAETPSGSTALPLPVSKPGGFTLAVGWSWALSNPHSVHAAESARLAEFLIQSDFQARWTEAAGYLPTRPTALAAWKGQNLQSLLGPVAMSAQAMPPAETIESLGPVLKEAVLQVIRDQGDPSQAANSAAQHFKTP
ncbi:MAG TPA: extracellular solute-binding protein [Anaerolineaceae bacterium]|nr:extracellular solute-binding protein [Anaerolineaceae bacterium]